jgi:hypothetical protein
MEKAPVEALDVPIVKLVPVRKRTVSAKSYAQLMANIKAVGLIEPLLVYREKDQFFILDGYVRYQVLIELGVQTVPCLIQGTKDTYTANRQVNHLTQRQETAMLRDAVESLGDETVAQAFGISKLTDRLGQTHDKYLHQEVLAAIKAGQMQRCAGRELSFVVPRRQLEIMAMMKQAGDSSAAFARAQVLRTPASMRSKRRRVNPWERSAKKQKDLTSKLQEVAKHHDFYSVLYRQYVGDLLKLAIYARQLISRPKLRAHLQKNAPDMLSLFESVVAESEGQSAVG